MVAGRGLLKAAGVNILYAAPKEGFRGWCSSEGISSNVRDPAKLQACYDYINWNYRVPGATIMRQGYYIANGAEVLPWIKSAPEERGFTPAEYDYWLGGSRRRATCPDHRQDRDIKKGERATAARSAAHLQLRAWNSYRAETVYLVQTVNDFLAA